MKRLILILLTASVTPVTGQIDSIEHAPTVQQCQADQRLWISMLETGSDSTALPAFRVLTKWTREMDQCKKVDPENQSRYYNTSSEIDDTQLGRVVDFLIRHNLYKQFIAEDEAGKRPTAK